MHQAIPYRSSWTPLLTPNHSHFRHNNNNNKKTSESTESSISELAGGSSSENMVKNMVLENAVIVIARRGCCMSHVVKRLLLGLGVNPAVYEVDEEDEVGVFKELEKIAGDHRKHGGKVQFPAVFIGGKLFGGLDRVMATHISGELVPILKDAGALWL